MSDLLAQHAAAVERAMRLEADRRAALPMIDTWRAMTAQQRAEAQRQAATAAERLRREAAEAHEKRHQEAVSRFQAVLDRVADPILRDVLLMHCPHHEDPDECAGCPHHDSRDGDDRAADWPCNTFLLVESAEP